MSEWNCEVVIIGKVGKHPNADSLSITQIHGGYPAIFRTEGGFKEGDLAVYIPVDSIVPDTEDFHFLAPAPKIGMNGEVSEPSPPVGSVPERYRRIKAKKLRGIFSMGMLMPAPVGVTPGQIVHEMMGITKYEPPEEHTASSGGQAEKGPEGWEFPKYTDIEGLRKFANILEFGEEVVITEKIHGQNARFCWDGERLWCGSKNEIKAEDVSINWWQVARDLNLIERFAMFPKTIFYGEIYGKSIQKLSYDRAQKDLIIFDTFDVSTGRWNDWNKTVSIAEHVGLPVVPVLYCGAWKGEEHWSLAEGNSTLANHIREGFVVKPVVERWHPHIGRVIFKLVGQAYLLSK